MGRSKAVAKRRRIEDEQVEKDAIELLLSIPQEQVEAAAAIATRESCRSWPKVETSDNDTTDKDTDTDNGTGTDIPRGIPEWLHGLGRSLTLPKPQFEVLQSLHESIKEQARVWTSWSGSPDDPRQRAFGFLPDTLGYETTIRDRLDISTPWSQDSTTANEEERKRNHRAMVVLESVPEVTKEAIDYLCQEFTKQLGKYGTNNNLLTYLQYSNLIAAQPNLHCGRELLPTHVDHPQKDGFGVIIVTISIVGSGTILLTDHTDQQKCTMEVSQGQAYMLSGRARDACAHGVVASSGHRESLNLRFGLHDLDKVDNHPWISSSNVLQYWETDQGKNVATTY